MSTTYTTAIDVKKYTRVMNEAELKYLSTLGTALGRVKAVYSLMLVHGVPYDYAEVCVDNKLDPSTALTTHPELFI